ncbi:MAG: leucine-rich repeat domain-containing protein [Clostridia bacterium]
MKTKVNERQKGITLIALVITIIVLLILAGVSIAMLTGDNGILNQANDSKIETAVGTVKEQLKLLQGEKIIQGEKVTPEILLAEGKVRRTVQLGENDKYYMYYALKENSVEGMQGLGKGDLTSLQDVFLIDDDLNVKYIASNGKEYGDQISKKILEDETEIKFSSKAFSEYISKISGVAEGEMKFKWMKNQTSLVIADPEVDSLQDLVFFPNLITLKIGNDHSGKTAPNIVSLEGIENCTKLTNITIIYGPDKDYKALSKLKNLKNFIKYGGRDYEEIIRNLAVNNSIEGLTISGQDMRSMDLIKKLINLKSLTLNNCEIVKIEGLEKMKQLKSLSLETNKIKVIEGLENLINLEKLDLYNNKIVDITPISVNSSIKELNLLKNPDIDGNRNNYTGERLEALNKIGEILDRGGIIYIDIGQIKLFNNYKELDLSYQGLETLEPLEGITELKKLDLPGNRLTLEDVKSQEILKNIKNLEILNLNNNKITNIKVINQLNNLKHLYLLGNNNIIELKQIEDIISNLDVLQVSTESLKTILNCDVNKITTLNIMGSQLTEIPDLSKLTKLSKLNIGTNPNISNFDILSKAINLTYLSMSNNNLHGRMIDFTKLINLVYLDLSNNTLWSEELENLKVLKNNTNLTINLSNNSIIDATALLELNPNTKINLTGNVNLSQESKDKLKERFGNNVSF